ncbi:MAG: 3-deoxy-manno-octulosonate cytidylyltransferase [Bacteroidales bacterium]
MRVLGIIPARYESSRFPGKPLATIKGKPMIQRVYEQASQSRVLQKLVVATDDNRIIKVVEGFGGKAILTKTDHSSGTERCSEVVKGLEAEGKTFDIIINIQGDEPYINPSQIEEVSSCFLDQSVSIATLIKRIDSADELFSPHVVKVVFDRFENALYFSRHAVPYRQKVEESEWLNGLVYFKHIGIYAYKPEILKNIVLLKTSVLEQAESLEQLRWLEHGFQIRVKETQYESHAVDTPEDLSKFFNNG